VHYKPHVHIACEFVHDSVERQFLHAYHGIAPTLEMFKSNRNQAVIVTASFRFRRASTIFATSISEYAAVLSDATTQ